MEYFRMFPSDLLTNWQSFQRAKMIWPFFVTQTKGKNNLIDGVKKQQVCFLKNGRTALFFRQIEKNDQKIITNLIVETKKISWRKVLTLLETAARSTFTKTLVIALHLPEKGALTEWFLEQGYQVTAAGFEKQLPYQTGLVLGGGGAHGAYQIGVWKALTENKIAIDIVTGASIGALNGALFVQGDCQKAIHMWDEIELDQVLHVSFSKLAETDFQTELQLLRSFARDFLQQKGFSSEPLRQLVRTQLPEVLPDQPPLYVITTQLPTFQEKVIHVQDYSGEKMLDYLIASSAFFPIMEKQVIDGVSYIDGGYRNNLPVDVAIKKGATECIVVDVKGPGIDRKITFSDQIAILKISSRWSLGGILLFDNFRSRNNLALGYLETQKALRKLQGSWYAFSLKEDFQSLTTRFNHYVKARIPNFSKSRRNLGSRLAAFFDERVPPEIYTIALLEQWGRWTLITPAKSYTILEIWQEIREAISQAFPEEPNLSLNERFSLYLEKHSAFSTYNQTLRIYLQQADLRAIQGNYKNQPMETLLALFLDFMMEEEKHGRL